ncbi:MAG: molybdenum cofactor biosynthesis protein MoaB [Candidatus Thermoplasmatota archaeon]|nr:molybdenum cofactor biosynthesis protein MoaB [Candidatus Thermoplasmatota archaeon]MCL6091270.1 molybdenum cofactor biosynthesis protein MoaB [Candidatus Thermoplasmatota archaeon]MDA8144343.1 molybdenum cofactor biosynthesis protein MoaB [Thermoplasmatales archaeon]
MHDHRIEDFHAKFGVLVCSSTRSMENDESGTAIIKLLEKNGHEVSNYEIVKDDEAEIIKMVLKFINDADAVVISGGTGITLRDVTVEAVARIAEYEMKSFSTIFSMLSFKEIGSSAMLSRASAFVVHRKPVFCLPGNPDGASLGIEELILKEIDHIHHELNR